MRQPWATLLVCPPPGRASPLKRAETRSWPPPGGLIGADVAIHAAARPAAAAPPLPDGMRGIPMPLGCVIGVGRCLSAWRVVAAHPPTAWIANGAGEVFSWEMDGLGDWAPGRWLWTWRGMDALPEPVPAKGRQGLWEWTQ